VYGFSLLAGEAEGVSLEADRGRVGEQGRGARAIFPVAPGDRRELVVHRLGDRSSYSVDVVVEAVVTETWIDGEAEPTISVD
jgi:hypothetical protein